MPRNRLIIPKQIFDEMLAHCREGCPSEVCGILAGTGNQVKKIYRMTNAEDSPVSYMMDSREQFKAMKDMSENNVSMLSIYHSHPSSPAYPSLKDVTLAFYDDAVYVIVSLMDDESVVKAYTIRTGRVEGEVEISVE